MEISGTGDLWMNAYGGITEVPIDGSFVVDNGHIVALDAGLDFGLRVRVVDLWDLSHRVRAWYANSRARGHFGCNRETHRRWSVGFLGFYPEPVRRIK